MIQIDDDSAAAAATAAPEPGATANARHTCPSETYMKVDGSRNTHTPTTKSSTEAEALREPLDVDQSDITSEM